MEYRLNKIKNADEAYKKQPASVEEIHPVKLIYLLYERAIAHLDAAKEGVIDNDLRQRGENLGKVMAIVTELKASIHEDDTSEAANFLRTIYSAILTELPRISISGELQNLQLVHGYMNKLKDLWEDSAMVEIGLGKENDPSVAKKEKDSSEPKSISVAV